MADDHDLNGIMGRRGILDDRDHAGGGQEEYEDNQSRDDRPGDLDFRTPIDLWRLAIIARLPLSESHDCVREQRKDDDKDDGCD
jgi:hypothetical protein